MSAFRGTFVGAGGGGSLLNISSLSAIAATTGPVATLSSPLAGTLTFSLLSGANVTVSSAGVVSFTTGLAADATRTFAARVQNAAGDAAERSFTMTGVAAAPTLGTITFGTATLTAAMAPGDVVQTLSGKTAGSTLTIEGDAFTAGRLAANAGGTAVVVGAAGPGAEGSFSGTYRAREVLAGATNTPNVGADQATITVGASVPALVASPGSPVIRVSPTHSIATVASGRVTSLPNLANAADPMLAIAAGEGAFLRTYPSGRKSLVFRGQEAMDFALATGNNRDCSVVMVARAYPNLTGATGNVFHWTSVRNGTATNLFGGTMRIDGQTVRPLNLRNADIGPSVLTDVAKVKCGTQLAVWGVRAAGTGAGATLLYMNGEKVSLSNATAGSATRVGCEIGRSASTAETFASQTRTPFELFDMIVHSPALSDAQMIAFIAAQQAAYGIPAIARDVIIEGDSITASTNNAGETVREKVVACRLTEPESADAWPANVRVIGHAQSGSGILLDPPGPTLNTINTCLEGRRTQAVTGFNAVHPTANHVTIQIGYNDWSAFGQSVADIRAQLIAQINTPTTGYLQRGFRVDVMTNIAHPSAATHTNFLNPHRINLLDPSFLVDCGAGPGGPFEGMVRVLPLHLYENPTGNTRFNDNADGTDTTVFFDTHPRDLGHQFQAQAYKQLVTF